MCVTAWRLQQTGKAIEERKTGPAPEQLTRINDTHGEETSRSDSRLRAVFSSAQCGPRAQRVEQVLSKRAAKPVGDLFSAERSVGTRDPDEQGNAPLER